MPEVFLFEQDHRGADDAVERAAGGVEDDGDVFEGLPGLLLDGVAGDLAGGRVLWPGAGDEDESGKQKSPPRGWAFRE